MEIARIKTSFIILTLAAAFLCAPFSAQAFSPWKGQISANINLRTAPGLNGRIITGIDRGAMVQVRAQEGDWYQIERETDAFGYIGWVYAKYVVAASSAGIETPAPALAQPHTEPASPQPSPGTANHSPAPTAAELPVQSAQLAIPTTTRAIIDPPQNARPLATETGTAPRPMVPAAPAADAASSPLPVAATKAEPSPGPQPAPAQMTAIAQHPAPTVPVAQARDQSPTAVAPPPAAVSAEIAAPTTAVATPYAGPQALAGLALRLLTTIFSCMALFMAFKAYQIARETAAQTIINQPTT